MINKKHRYVALLIAFVLLLTSVPILDVFAYPDTEEEFYEYLLSTNQRTRSAGGKLVNFNTYRNYGFVVYGNPWGECEWSPITNKNEYRYLGYTYDDGPYTNSKFPNDARGTKSPLEWTYESVSNAASTWDNVSDNELYNHMFNSNLSFEGTTYTGLNVSSIGTNKAKILNLPSFKNGFSVYTRHKGSDGKLYYATLTGPPMAGSNALSCTVTTSSNTYIIKPDQDSVTIPVTVTGNVALSGYAKASHIEDIKIAFEDNSKSGAAVSNLNLSADKVFTRQTLGVGTHTITLKGSANMETVFNDQYSTTGSKTVTIEVMELATNITVINTPNAEPSSVQFSNIDIPVRVTVNAELINYTNIGNIKEWSLYARKKEDATAIEIKCAPGLTATASFDFVIPKDKLTNVQSYIQEFVTSATVRFNSPVYDSKADQKVTFMTDTKNCLTSVYKLAPPPPSNGEPPMAILKAPTTVMAGDEFYYNARDSVDPDGYIEHYYYDTPVEVNGSKSGDRWRAWYSVPGTYEVELEVEDNDGNDDSDYHTIKVTDPVPAANIAVTGTLKENRKFTIDLTGSTSPTHYPINWAGATISIVPVSGGAAADIKYFGSLNGVNIKDVLIKKSGTYRITARTPNTYGLSDTATMTITIAPDEEPKANFFVETKVLRDPENGSRATIKLSDDSYSPDGDTISSRVWKYKYDSNNNNSFDDEAWEILDNDNNTSPELITTSVGKYLFELEAEESFGQPSIPEFILASDIRIGTTDSKAANEKNVEVINTAPVLDYVVQKKKPVDIIVMTDYTGQKLANLQSQITLQKANLMGLGLDPVFHLISDVKKIGTQSDSLYWYRRYAYYNYVLNYYEIYTPSSSWNYYSHYPRSEKLLWEEMQGLASQVNNLPKRNPTASFTRSALLHRETSTSETDYYNVRITATNDIKSSSENIEIRKRYDSENLTSVWEFDYIESESATIDKTWTREEKIGNVTYDVFSLDFSKLNTLPLRADSDRHMVFLSDASAKNYGTGFGNYFSFGDMTSSLQTYIETNKVSLYGVMDDMTADSTILSDKVAKIFPLGNMSLFYMKNGTIQQLGDPALAATLANGEKMYPKAASDITGVKEIIQQNGGQIYLLMNNGTIKYVPSGTNTLATLSGVSGITKVFYNSSSIWIYAVNGSGKVFKINDDDVYPLNNSIVCDKVIPLNYTEILLTANGTPYMEYTIEDKQRDTETTAWGQVRIRDRNTDALSYLGSIKDAEIVYSSYGLYPIAIQLSSDVVRQYVGLTGSREQTTRYDYWYQEIYYDSAYKIDTSSVDRIENTGGSIFIYYKNGTVKMLVADLIKYHDSEEGDYYVPQLRNYLVNVPVTNIQKTLAASTQRYFMTDSNNNTYMYNAATTSPNPVMGSNLISIGNDVKGIYQCRIYYNYSKIYILKNDGTVRELTFNGNAQTSDKILPYTNIENIYVSDKNAFLVDKNGYVYGTGNTQYGQLGYKNTANYITTYVNPLPTTLNVDTAKPYISMLDLFNNTANAKFFPAGDFAGALNDIANSYTVDPSFTSNYLLLGDTVDYSLIYSDYEIDPELQRYWTFTHDDKYFDNSLGLHPDSGKQIATPIMKFDKVGRYVSKVNVRDNPLNKTEFDSYRLMNRGDNTVTLYVHRKPIALIDVSITPNGSLWRVEVSDGGSYDLDHTSRADKGITSTVEWAWKEENETDWHNVRMVKSDCDSSKNYQVRYRVKDLEGAWSDYAMLNIGDDSPPVAKFNIQTNPLKYTELAQIKDTSYAIFSSLTNWRWVVKNNANGAILQDASFTSSNTGTGGYDTNVKTNYATPGIGNYDITLYVRNSNNVWSDPYTQTLNVVNPNVAPAVALGYTPGVVYEGDDVSINMLPTDPDGDMLDIVLEERRNSGSWTEVYTRNDSPAGTQRTFVKNDITPGSYEYRVTVTDPYGLTATDTLNFTVNDLSITGQVNHTVLWNQHRIDYNRSKTGTNDNPRSYSVFFPGERFMLNAETTAIDPSSTVFASDVDAEILGTSLTDDMDNAAGTTWEGSLWDVDMERWGNQNVTFRFTVTYSNGTVKTDDVTIAIGDDNYWQLHRKD